MAFISYRGRLAISLADATREEKWGWGNPNEVTGCLYRETVRIEDVGMPFQIGSGHGQGWHQFEMAYQLILQF